MVASCLRALLPDTTRGNKGKSCCCRDQVPYQKVYTALSVIELEFDWTLTNFAYQAVLKVCAKDMSEPAARMALRILDGLRVRVILCTWARSHPSHTCADTHLPCTQMQCSIYLCISS